MKRRMIALSLFLVTGCATAHDYCISHAEHYANYDECYAERSAANAKSKEHFQNIFKSFDSKGQEVECESRTIGNRTTTSCSHN